MADPDFVLALYRDIRWGLVLGGVVLLFLALYKLLWVHEKSNNGQIKSYMRLPELSLRKPALSVSLKHRQYTDQQLKLFSVVYLTQQILFGMLLFIAGLSLCLLAIHWWLSVEPERLLCLFTALAGLLLMIAGVCASLFRDRGNPFSGS